jgi:hypothetical protein
MYFTQDWSYLWLLNALIAFIPSSYAAQQQPLQLATNDVSKRVAIIGRHHM